MAKERVTVTEMPTYDTSSFLAELEPTAGALLEKHLRTAKEWFPHKLVPWSAGRDFTGEDLWTPEDYPISDEVRSALYLNLMTEDNLPYYFRDINNMFGDDDAWGEWGRRWTAEEGRHAIVIRDYLTVTRAYDPELLEKGRMKQVSGGESPTHTNPAEMMVYVTLQELATRVSHLNTGKALLAQSGKHAKGGYEVMMRVAADENLHYLFYAGVTEAALKLDPSVVMIAIERQIKGFEMPGTGVDNYKLHADRIALAGIYDYHVHHDAILIPALYKKLKILEVDGLSAQAEQSRDRTVVHMGRLGRAARRLAQQKADKAGALEAAS